MIAFVYGTRPEAIKIRPILRELPRDEYLTICTYQHEELLSSTELDPDIRIPIRVDEPRLSNFVGQTSAQIEAFLQRETPSILVVQGDTATAMGAALGAFHAGVPVAHVEAGLRSGNLAHPFPEEGYRQLLDRLSTKLYAPTELAAENLRGESVTGTVLVTGNTSIDELFRVRGDAPRLRKRPFIYATIHRREALPHIKEIAQALNLLAESRWIRIPIHPNPVGQGLQKLLGPKIELLPPLPHAISIRMVEEASLVITDSGGVQEEAPTLGTPVVIVRETTERPEVLQRHGKLAGLTCKGILEAVAALGPVSPENLFGDGQAGKRIAADLLIATRKGL